MTSRDFCYWLQGFFEIAEGGDPDIMQRTDGLTYSQVEMIKKHLALVFLHEIDPSAGDAAHQAKLNEAHGKPPVHDKPPPFQKQPSPYSGSSAPDMHTVYRC